ncbi:MAG TPA: sigma 54-interacting transcriptional regulator [Candidatus Binatia bacterium]|nr:sigma 54-interacting transcriptional regulator [Candidatus Binatia bacterium]
MIDIEPDDIAAVKRQIDRQSSEGGKRPLYFNLLFEEDLVELRPVLAEIGRRRDEVLEEWWELYQLHFGDTRTLSEPEFLRVYGADLDATGALGAGDFGRFADEVHDVGERLAGRGVPFPEVIASMHLFEQAASGVFPTTGTTGHTYMVFDKLSHCRMIVLADAYFQSIHAAERTRIRELERDAAALGAKARSRFQGLVGAAVPMRQLYERIEAAASTRGTVLVVGESGTGKELVARAIHECASSPRAPFVALNCAAIPRELIESELFGYKRGAFSGAATEYLGLFRAAEGGTIFLDEITEMSPETQSKLLRVIQERLVRPVGSTSEVPVNVRLITSTNRNPEQAVTDGRLRRDLYYRLHVNVLKVPPLRERSEDIPLLVEHFITLFNERLRPAVPVLGIDGEALAALEAYSWPGNVRELANTIEAAFTFGRSETIRMSHLPPEISHQAPAKPTLHAGPLPTFADAERELVHRALAVTRGNKVQAAKLLRISRKKLYAKIGKYGLRTP